MDTSEIARTRKVMLVTGDRDWTNEELIQGVLTHFTPTVVIHGGARGADTLAGVVADRSGIHTAVVRARWSALGRAAGVIRNRAMLDLKPDIVVAFHNDLANSKGTKDCVDEARRRGYHVYLYKELGDTFQCTELSPYKRG